MPAKLEAAGFPLKSLGSKPEFGGAGHMGRKRSSSTESESDSDSDEESSSSKSCRKTKKVSKATAKDKKKTKKAVEVKKTSSKAKKKKAKEESEDDSDSDEEEEEDEESEPRKSKKDKDRGKSREKKRRDRSRSRDRRKRDDSRAHPMPGSYPMPYGMPGYAVAYGASPWGPYPPPYAMGRAPPGDYGHTSRALNNDRGDRGRENRRGRGEYRGMDFGAFNGRDAERTKWAPGHGRNPDLEDDTFAAVLFESSSICRRGAILYPHIGELTVSFNGGKDACVLYLWLAVLLAIEGELPVTPQVIFFDSGDEFGKVKRFVTWTVRSLELEMTVEHRSFRVGMESLVANNVKAVVMGQRSVDPWMTGVDAFTPSTDGWPAFMRINPIMKWSYHHVWIFLRQFGFPYCELYDQGFTSLGSVKDTQPNPALKRSDGSFAPAYELKDGTLERDGRTSSKSGKATKQYARDTLAVAAIVSPLQKSPKSSLASRWRATTASMMTGEERLRPRRGEVARQGANGKMICSTRWCQVENQLRLMTDAWTRASTAVALVT
eukprot:s1044_g11.t1